MIEEINPGTYFFSCKNHKRCSMPFPNISNIKSGFHKLLKGIQLKKM
jgi:hypothetical protein